MKVKYKQIGYIVLFFLAGAALLILGVSDIVKDARLNNSGQVALATVDDWRVYNGKHVHNSHEIQYSFRVKNDDTVYYRGWARIPIEEWNLTKMSKSINVVYDPKNPWNSRAFNEEPFDITGSIIFIIAGLFLTASCIYILVKSFTRKNNGIFEYL